MALIKCEECKKDVSDKAVSCPNCGAPIVKKAVCVECGNLLDPSDKICGECGCPVEDTSSVVNQASQLKIDDIIKTTKNTSEGKNNTLKTGARVWLVLGIIACFGLAVFYLLGPAILNFNMPSILLFSESNTVIYPMHFLAVLLGITYCYMLKYGNRISYYLMLAVNLLVVLVNIPYISLVISLFNVLLVAINVVITSLVCFKQLNKSKMSKVGIGVLVGLFIASLVLCVCSSSIFYNEYDRDDEDVILDTLLDEPTTTTTRYLTPKQKMNDRWTRLHGAACTEEMCMYLFEAAGTQTYYTLDYNKRIYEQDFFSTAGETYYKYDFGKDTGYGKMTVIAGYASAKVEVNVTFDAKKNEYRYKWTCSLNDCKSIAEDMAKSIDGMRTDLFKDCDELGINIADLK